MTKKEKKGKKENRRDFKEQEKHFEGVHEKS